MGGKGAQLWRVAAGEKEKASQGQQDVAEEIRQGPVREMRSRLTIALAVLVLAAVTIAPTTMPIPEDPLDTERHFLASERLCSSNFDCESPLTCREYPTGSAIRRCSRFWELSDPAEVTKIKCSDDSCGLS